MQVEITPFDQCLPFLTAARAKQLAPPLPIWDLGHRGWPWSHARSAYVEARRAILRAFVTQAPHCFLKADPSDVADWPDAASWGKAAENTFQLTQGVDAQMLARKILYAGNYLLYWSDAPVPEVQWSFDVWLISPRELLDFLHRWGVFGLLVSFFDDIEWRLALPVVTSGDTAD